MPWLCCWLLMVGAGAEVAPDEPRWLLSVELPRTARVAGVGRLEIVTRASYLLRGDGLRLDGERCSLAATAPLARAVALDAPGPAVRLRFVAAGERLSADAATLLPTGPVRFALRAADLPVMELIVTTSGRLRLEGRAIDGRLAGAVTLVDPIDRIEGTPLLGLHFVDEDVVHGRFTLSATSARRCEELRGPPVQGGAP